MEKWTKLENYSRYEVSNTGKIRSTNYKNSGKTKELKPSLNPTGYPCTMLQNDDGKYISRPIHYFITLAFFGIRKPKYEVNHLDGDKTNNNINNLEYCTHSDNCQHAVDTGLWEVRNGSKNGNSKLTEQNVLEIREHAANNSRYYGRKMLADKYGVTESHIKAIVRNNGKLWKYV